MPKVRYEELEDLIREETEGLSSVESIQRDREEKLRKSKKRFMPNEPEE